MQLELSNIGKHFAYRWVFKNISLKLEKGQSVAITGPNGIGKSTLLKIIASYMEASEGSISYKVKDKTIVPTEIYKHISYAAPYIDLINEYSLSELIEFYTSHKSVNENFLKESLKEFKLENNLSKSLKFFSSGMLQRTKLMLALSSETEILLLDEPHTNLDKSGIEVYNHLIQEKLNDCIVILSSNREEEISFCKSQMELMPINT